LLRQVRNPARERSRNLNREVWESPSVYGGEDVIRPVRLDQQDSSPSPLLAAPRSPIAFKQDLVRIMPEATKLRVST
ncbi:MAG: hypothetical protein NT917_15910, partial [Microcystis aeruginosa WS75]|nr:hypothetical protein [Microcystis aeruginosa WS75]